MSDNKTSILHNPVIWADVPDVDVIRVNDVFYMVSTSMHSMPGCPIMKSTDLVHWELVSYVFDTLEDNDAHNLKDGAGIYGKGSWACSLRYHHNTFYVCFACNDMQKTYIYRTHDIEKGEWTRTVLDALFHDPSLFFDDHRVFILYGNGEIKIIELTEDAAAIKAGGVNRLLFETERTGMMLRCEGCHAYKINGMYYLFLIEWPSAGNKRRREVCYRSKELLGEYEFRIVMDDDLGYHNKGVAQGGIFDTAAGEWYAALFQDHDAVGRIPCILPVKWEDGWPVLGVNGKVAEKMETPLKLSPMVPLVISDSFDHPENKLAVNWQWNHNPDNRLWSFTGRPGFLRFVTGYLAPNVLQARNTLTQRTEGPACSCSTRMEVSHMKAGDCAGLVALQYTYGSVGVKADAAGCKYIVMSVNSGDGSPDEVEQIQLPGDSVHLMMDFDFKDSRDIARFFYSFDGSTWTKIGCDLAMKYTLDHFMGYRMGLYYYATKETGGIVDYQYFHYRKGTDR